MLTMIGFVEIVLVNLYLASFEYSFRNVNFFRKLANKKIMI